MTAARLISAADVSEQLGIGRTAAYALMRRLPCLVYIGTGKRRVVRAIADVLQLFLRAGGRSARYPGGYVYALRHGEHGPIKIGWAMDVPHRMRELQCGNPFVLHLLAVWPGERSAELHAHETLAAHALRGEWFAPHHDVCAYIEQHDDRAGIAETEWRASREQA